MKIGLSGLSGSGKTTIAKIISNNYGLELLSFAWPVKNIAMHEFGWDGQKDDRGRRLLQVLGTDAGRIYDDGIWVRKMIHHIRYCDINKWIIDDVRFDNEAITVNEEGGFVFRITGRGQDNTCHQSEAGISDEHICEEIDNSANDGGESAAREIIAYIEGAQ